MKHGRLICCVFLLAVVTSDSSYAQFVNASLPSLPTAEIVSRMTEKNHERANALKDYTGVRTYHLLYKGFPGKREARMVVRAQYQAPDMKEFTVISQSGSSFIINRVFKRLIESEQEAAEKDNAARNALDTNNYEFKFLGQEDVYGRPAYVLQVIPKRDYKYLYRGKVWVDGSDFAVVQIEAEPAKRPSFWITRTEIHHIYGKVADFWLPAENISTSHVRLGGTATLTIQYTDYAVNKLQEANQQEAVAR